MTQREKVLGLAFLGVLTVVGGGAGLYVLGLAPYLEAREALKQTEDSLRNKQDEVAREKSRNDEVLRLNPRLAHWQKISLPAMPPLRDLPTNLTAEQRKKFLDARKQEHVKALALQYERYLS